MYRLTLLTVGSIREPWAREAAKMYMERLRPSIDFHVVELPPSRQPNASGQMVEESERLLISAEKLRGQIWVLDESGKQMTSQIFSQELSQLQDIGDPVIFILGGAYGLTDKVKTAARKIISLSNMTLPHELCRILFLEQLYRAMEIKKGSGYHH